MTDENLGKPEDANLDPLRQTAKIVVDARQMPCPMPLLKAKQALSKIEIGDLVFVDVTDPSSVRDFHAFVELTEHELVDFKDEKGSYTYLIRKGQ
ncbi:MAG: sulfurtransferase TusA family protein [Agarilytica sp.]